MTFTEQCSYKYLLNSAFPVPSLYLPCTFPVPSLYLPCTFTEQCSYRYLLNSASIGYANKFKYRLIITPPLITSRSRG
jgi:hypothetical protein